VSPKNRRGSSGGVLFESLTKDPDSDLWGIGNGMGITWDYDYLPSFGGLAQGGA